MELLALLIALSPIIVTILFGVAKLGARPSEKMEVQPLQVQEELVAPMVQVAPLVAATVQAPASHNDEIAAVLAAAASMYIKSTK